MSTRTNLGSALLVGALALAGAADVAHGQCELAKRGPTDAEAGDQFGRSVAIQDDLAIVGVAKDRVFGVTTGSAAIFDRNQGGPDVWGQIAKLVASDGAAGDQFGTSVSIAGDFAIVGAVGVDDAGSRSGAAYVFARNEGGTDQWGQVAKLVAGDPAANDQFGNAVGIAGDLAIVGSSRDDDNGSSSGSAYIFARNHGGADQWGELAKLVPGDGARYDSFGFSVSIFDSFALVGAPRDDDDGSSSGSAYLFERDEGGADAWGQVIKLHAGDAARNDQFGMSVALDGGMALVGAYLKDGVGAAYLFDRDFGGADTWGQRHKLVANDAATGDYFGYAVSLHEDLAVVGAMGDDDAGTSSGSAYVFMQDQGGENAWGQRWKLLPEDGATYDLYGLAVGVAGDHVVVGSVYDDDAGPSSGSAYLHERVGGGFNNFEQIKKLAATDGAGDRFGRSVGISGDRAIIGSSLDNLVGPESGSAYILAQDLGGPDTWSELLKLSPTDAAAYDLFGVAVAIDGDYAIVGAPGKDDFAGAVYFFERDAGGADAWGQVAALRPADVATADRFGVAVAIDGDTAVAGAVYADVDGLTDAGCVFVYERGVDGTWLTVKKLVPGDSEAFDWFGVSVGVSGDTIIVGADNKSFTPPPLPSSGSAYLFERDAGGLDNWGQTKQFVAMDAATNDHFGGSVAIAGDLAVVGAADVDDLGTDAGSVYVYARDEGGPDNWGGVRKLFASDGTAGARFGVSVTTDGATILVGADQDSDGAFEAGAAYLFEVGPDFAEVTKFVASDASAGAFFGCALGLDGDRAVISADLDGAAGPDAGAAYLLDLGGFDCNLNGVCDSVEVRDRTSQDVNENGTPDECECLSDLDVSNNVDWVDWMLAYSQWGPCEGCQADRNGDGVVDVADLNIILSEFGECPY